MMLLPLCFASSPQFRKVSSKGPRSALKISALLPCTSSSRKFAEFAGVCADTHIVAERAMIPVVAKRPVRFFFIRFL